MPIALVITIALFIASCFTVVAFICCVIVKGRMINSSAIRIYILFIILGIVLGAVLAYVAVANAAS